MSRLERTLVLGVFRYVEPRRAPAATYGLCEPLSFYRGAGTPLLPRPSASLRNGRQQDVFRRFGIVWCPYPIENYGHMGTQDYPMCLESGRSLLAPFSLYT